MIAVIGGTGKLGRGLVSRLAKAGEEAIIGSRTPEKAERISEELSEKTGEEIRGSGNLEATRKSDVIFLSIPASAIENIVQQIKPGLDQGNILVSVVVPISREGERFTIQELNANSAAEKISLEAPDEVSIVSVFQMVPSSRLQTFEEPLDSDIPICGDNSEAKRKIMDIIEKFPDARPIDAGALANSELVEPAAAFLVELSRIHGEEISVRFKGI